MRNSWLPQVTTWTLLCYSLNIQAVSRREMDDQTRVYKPQATKEMPYRNQAYDEAMYHAFKVTAGADGEIDAFELQGLMNFNLKKEVKFDGFNIETCRSLVALWDKDHSGMLGFEEFKKLWDDLCNWKEVFKKFDKDNSGTFDEIELREAFRASGFHLSSATFKAIKQRHRNKEGKINFDDYIHCFVRLKCMFDVWNELDKEHENSTTATIQCDEFIQTTMYS